MCFAASFWAYIPKVVFACSRNRAADYYEGDHDIAALNKVSRRKIELVHAKEFEEAALAVITQFEQTR